MEEKQTNIVIEQKNIIVDDQSKELEEKIVENVPTLETIETKVVDVVDSKPIEKEQQEVELSTKIKTRKDYIKTIKDLCEKLEIDVPKALTHKNKSDLKKILSTLATSGTKRINGLSKEDEEKCSDVQEQYGVMVLWQINTILFNVLEHQSYKFKSYLGGCVCKNVVKKLEENKNKCEQLRMALKKVWEEYREEIGQYMNCWTTLALVNISILSDSLEKEETKNNVVNNIINVKENKKMETKII